MTQTIRSVVRSLGSRHCGVMTVCAVTALLFPLVLLNPQVAEGQSAPPNLVTNGSFEVGPADAIRTVSAPNATAIPGWTVSAGDIDSVNGFWTAADGTRSLDMNGDHPGAISQTIGTQPGASYLVRFSLAGNPGLGAQDFVLRATAAGTAVDFAISTTSESSFANMGWQEMSFTFVATASSTTLTFSSVGTDNVANTGPALDNVRMQLLLPNLVLNGSFEVGPADAIRTVSAPNATAIPGWTVSAGDIDFVNGFWTAADGTRSLDLNGDQAGTIAQAVPTQIGASYVVQFALAGNPGLGLQDFVLRASAGAMVLDFPISTTASSSFTSMGWQERSFTFTATAVSTTLAFASVGTTNDPRLGPALDNVRMRLLEPAPPVADTTPPVITPQVNGTLGTPGWYRSDVTVSWIVGDAESTVSSTSGCGPTTISTDTAGTTLTCTATSSGGAASGSVTIQRDVVRPTVVASAQTADGNPYIAGTITSQDVTVSFACTDAGSGLVGPCPSAFAFHHDFANKYSSPVVVCDLALNCTTTTFGPININGLDAQPIHDATPPAIPDPVIVGTLGLNGWYTSDVTVIWTGISDPESPLSIVDCPLQTINQDTGFYLGKTITCKAISSGGVRVKSVVVKRDATPPSFLGLSNVNVQSTTFPVNVTYPDATVYDYGGSLLNGFACSPASGSLFPRGSTQVHCTAKDNAGNASTGSFAVTVQDASVLVSPTTTLIQTQQAGPGQVVTASTVSGMAFGPGLPGVTATLNNAGTGTAALSVATYSGNVSSGRVFDAGGTYTDVQVQGATASTTATAKFYYPKTVPDSVTYAWDEQVIVRTPRYAPGTNAVFAYSLSPETVHHTKTIDHELRFENTAGSFDLVKSSGGLPPQWDTTDNLDGTASNGRFIVTFDMTSTPKITELSGTVFGDGFDTTPPVLSAPPADMTVEANTYLGATVDFTAPTAVDNLDGPIPVTCQPGAGETFLLGYSGVFCSATDTAGNTVTGGFSVTVVDTTPPVITAPPTTTIVTAANGGIDVNAPAIQGWLSQTSANEINDGPATVFADLISGPYTSVPIIVTFSAVDSTGNASNATARLNRAPRADAGPDHAVNEDSTVLLNAAGSSDPDGDGLTFHWDLLSATGPAVTLSSASSPMPTFFAADNGSYTFRLTVSDGFGGSATDDVVIAVNNVAPGAVTVTADPAAINRDDSTTLSGAFADPGTLDTHTVVIEWDDGSANTTLNLTAGVLSYGATHQYLTSRPGNTPYAINVRVTDTDGGTAAASTEVTVIDGAPSNLTATVISGPVSENGLTTISGSFTDPGPADTHTVVIGWGDGSANTTLTLLANVLSYSASHQYLDNNAGNAPYAVGVTVADSAGGSATASTAATVNNVAPSNATATALPPAIYKNGSTTLSGSFADAGTLDSHTVVINWGDGSPTSTLHLAANVLNYSAVHQYTSVNTGGAPYTVSIAITDKDGAAASGGTTVTVADITPTAHAGPAQTITVRQAFTLTGTFTVPGGANGGTYTWKWAPLTPALDHTGAALAPSTGTVTYGQSKTYSADIAVPGVYAFSFTITDQDGASSASTVTVTVPDRNWVVFGSNSVYFKEGSKVLSGDVAGPFQASRVLDGHSEVSVGANAQVAQGSAVYADSLRVKSKSSVPLAYYNNLEDPGPDNVVTGVNPLPAGLAAPSLPTPGGSSGTEDIWLNGNKGDCNGANITCVMSGATLAPGAYGDLKSRGGDKKKPVVLYLSAGSYYFESIDLASSSELRFTGTAAIYVAKQMDTDNGDVIGPAAGSSISARNIMFWVGGINGRKGGVKSHPMSIQIGTDNTLAANLYAPNGTIWLASGTVATGAFVAKDVEIGTKVTVALDSSF